MNILKNYKFSFILILGMLVGSTIGVIFGEKATVLQPIADIFLNLLYCCVVPMIFVSLVYSISNMENTNKLGKVLGIMIVIFLLAETIAAIYMLIITIIFNPAEGANIAMNETINNMTSNSNILAMFTVNDFPLLWSRQNLMALIVFAMLIGIATVKVGEVGKPVVKFFGSLTSIISKVVSYVMYIAPIGLGAFFATLVGQNGAALSGPLSRALIIYFIAAVVFYFLSEKIMRTYFSEKKTVAGIIRLHNHNIKTPRPACAPSRAMIGSIPGKDGAHLRARPSRYRSDMKNALQTCICKAFPYTSEFPILLTIHLSLCMPCGCHRSSDLPLSPDLSCHQAP